MDGADFAVEAGPVEGGAAAIGAGVDVGAFGRGGAEARSKLVVDGGAESFAGGFSSETLEVVQLGEAVVGAIPAAVDVASGVRGRRRGPEFFEEVEAAEAGGDAEIERGEGDAGELGGVGGATVEEGVDHEGAAVAVIFAGFKESKLAPAGEEEGDAGRFSGKGVAEESVGRFRREAGADGSMPRPASRRSA